MSRQVEIDVRSENRDIFCPVYKISWFSKVCRLKARILPVIPDRDKLFLEQCHHIYKVFHRVQTEGDSANMRSHAEIHFILMFGVAMLYDSKADKSLHVVIGAVPSVADKDVPGIRQGIVAVNHTAESPEFIFLMNGLDEGIGINVLLQIIKSVQMHAVKPFCGIAFCYKVFRGRKERLTEKSKS